MNTVIIISTNAIGDTFLSFSAIEFIKKQLKDYRIDFVVDENSYQMFKSIPGVSKFYIIKKDLKTIWKIVSKLRSEQYKFSFNFFPGRINSFINYFSGAQKKAGYIELKKNINWHIKKQMVVVNGKKMKKYCWHPNMEYLARISLVLQSIGISTTGLKKIRPINKELLQKSTAKQIVIHPFSRFPERSFSKKTLILLVNFLTHNDYKTEIICSSLDLKYNFLKLLQSTNVKISNDQDLKYLTDHIYSAQLFIAVDSFPLHIADAHNSSFLGIFGPTYCNSVLTNREKGVQLKTSSLQNVSFESILPHIEHRLKISEHINE